MSNKNSKKKSSFLTLFSKKNKNIKETKEEKFDDSDDEIGYDDNSKSIELANIKQKQDFINNSQKNHSNSLLNDLSLGELTALEKELEFKYSFNSYNIINVERRNNFLYIKCELINHSSSNKQTVVEKIPYKEIKINWTID